MAAKYENGMKVILSMGEMCMLLGIYDITLWTKMTGLWLLISPWSKMEPTSWMITSAAFLLTHWGLDKMAANCADDIFKCIFLNENDYILIQISLKFVPNGPIDTIIWTNVHPDLYSTPYDVTRPRGWGVGGGGWGGGGGGGGGGGWGVKLYSVLRGGCGGCKIIFCFAMMFISTA